MITVSARAASVALETDVCIVGSGAGGSAVALAVCRASRDVVLLEAGDHHDPATFDQRESTMMAPPLSRRRASR